MARTITNGLILAGPVNVSGDANEIAWESNVTEEDSTTFASGGAEDCEAGLFKASLAVSGFFNAGAGAAAGIDDAAAALMGVTGQPFTVIPSAGAEGDRALFTRSMMTKYSQRPQVGKIIPFNATARSAGVPLVESGFVMHYATRVATGTGTIFNIGAVPAGKNLFAAVHVLSLSGTAAPTLTLALQNAAAVGFAGPTTLVTFPAFTAPGSGWFGLPGAVANAYYRLSWTITGTNPSFLFAVAIGVR